MADPADFRIVFCTVPDAGTGRRIAERLVEYRLAACVNLIPGLESIYRWKGEIQHDAELLLMIKTTVADYEALERAIRDLHPYELPEIVAVPLSNGLADYLNWISKSREKTE
ncbi:MAG TPA: divalent-cation tolerance protein CutA [Gammaproteobacteria bacterium]|nr:divalent-cation tolerance protein CutA [Gammaproteobacteria bacterium]